MTFSTMDRVGRSWKNWKMTPMCLPRMRAGGRCGRRRASYRGLRAEKLVGPGENGHFFGRPPVADAGAFAAGLLERDAAGGRLGVFLDGGLAGRVAAPPGNRPALFQG